MTARRGGRIRPFWRGLLLAVVTLGAYGAWWGWRAHQEVYDAFRLHEEGRSRGGAWLALGLVLVLPLAVYGWIFASNVERARARAHLAPATHPALLALVPLAALALYFAGMLAALSLALSDAIVDPSTGLVAPAWARLVLALVVGTLVASGALAAWPFYRMQRSLNELWRRV